MLFAGAALLVLNLVVPPFQNPDEPHHFAAVVLYARGPADGGMANEQAAVESGVLRMMDRANWWRLVGIGRPQPLPKQLTEISFFMEGMRSKDFRARLSLFELWHRLAGAAMRPFAGWPLERLYYAGRAVSALFLAGALVLIWLAFNLLGAASLFGPGVRQGFWVVFFLPQFWLTGTAVSPDAFVVLLGAAFFYGAAALLFGKSRGAGRTKRAWVGGLIKAWPAVLVIFVPIVGMLTDRAAFVLALMAALLGLLYIRRGNWQTSVPWILIGLTGAIWAVYFAALKFPFAVERIYLNLIDILGKGTAAVGGILDINGFARPFWGFTMDGILLKFGWQVFEVSKAVYWIWRFVLIASGIGLAVRLVKWAKARMNDGGGEEGAGGGKNAGGESGGGGGEEGEEGGAPNGPLRARWFVFAVAAVAIQGVGMWAFYGKNGIIGQGRYFFPVILPLAFLLASGLTALGDAVKRGAGRKIVAAVILGEFLVLAVSLWTHIIPAFHLILRGPHPGV